MRTGHQQAGELGLNMTGPVADANPTTALDIVGDYKPMEYTATLNAGDPTDSSWRILSAVVDSTDANGAATAYTYTFNIVDTLGNLIQDTSKPDATRADTLYDSTGNDHIISGGGDDTISAYRGGDDVIEAGAGQDYVFAGEGNDVIIGGAGSDALDGFAGNDRIYADTQISVASAIAMGNPSTGSGQATGSGLRGDALSGDSGDDTLIGSNGNDVLSGGAGADLLIGGAGIDYIFGDTDWAAGPAGDWSASPAGLTGGAGGIAPWIGNNSDVIYAGAGDDHVWGELGNDVIFGEGGADELVGNSGNDIILGGGNNDIIYGDLAESANFAAAPGNDYLDGGAEDDVIYGNEGDDILVGGTGDDTLVGGTGKDTYIYNRGDGTDWIYDTKGENNILRFGAGTSSSDVHLELGSLKLNLGNGDEIHIANFDRNDVFNSSSIGSFEFADVVLFGRERNEAANEAVNAWRIAA